MHKFLPVVGQTDDGPVAMVRLRQPVTSIEGPSRHRRDPLLAPSGEQVQQGADRSLSATLDMKWTFESFYRPPRRIPFPGRCPRRPKRLRGVRLADGALGAR